MAALARRMRKTSNSIVALVGVALASTSALLAIWLVCYGYAIGGIPHHDPLLVASFRTGLAVSAVGTAFAAAGLKQSGRLKWWALAWALVGVAFWSVRAVLK